MSNEVPFMKRWPMQFWTSKSVLWLSVQKPSAHLEYNALLDQMWINDGRFPDDDGLIAAAIRVSLDHWLERRDSILQIVDQVTDENGVVYLTQKRLRRDYATTTTQLQQRNENLAKGREKANAKKQAKSKKNNGKSPAPQEPVTDASNSPQYQAPVTGPSTGTAKQSIAEQSREEQSRAGRQRSRAARFQAARKPSGLHASRRDPRRRPAHRSRHPRLREDAPRRRVRGDARALEAAPITAQPAPTC